MGTDEEIFAAFRVRSFLQEGSLRDITDPSRSDEFDRPIRRLQLNDCGKSKSQLQAKFRV